MKKTLAILLAFCLCIGLCACGGNDENSINNTNKPTTTQDESEHIPTQEEIETMYQQAKDYEANARFDEAINLYRTVYKYGFSDPDYSSKTPEEVLEIRENRFVLQAISCQYFEYALWLFNDEIVKRLNDPNSLQIHSLTMKEDDSNPDRFKVVFDYGAANSFGGMVRDTFEAPYTLTDSDAERIYQYNKNYIDSNGCTVAEYLVGNYYFCTISEDTQMEAIINGTATYSNAEVSIPDNTTETHTPTTPPENDAAQIVIDFMEQGDYIQASGILYENPDISNHTELVKECGQGVIPQYIRSNGEEKETGKYFLNLTNSDGLQISVWYFGESNAIQYLYHYSGNGVMDLMMVDYTIGSDEMKFTRSTMNMGTPVNYQEGTISVSEYSGTFTGSLADNSSEPLIIHGLTVTSFDTAYEKQTRGYQTATMGYINEMLDAMFAAVVQAGYKGTMTDIGFTAYKSE